MNKNMILLLSIFGLFLFLRLSQRSGSDKSSTNKTSTNKTSTNTSYKKTVSSRTIPPEQYTTKANQRRRESEVLQRKQETKDYWFNPKTGWKTIKGWF